MQVELTEQEVNFLRGVIASAPLQANGLQGVEALYMLLAGLSAKLTEPLEEPSA